MAATNNKLAYASSAAVTITLASLASSASSTSAGRASAEIDNTTNLYEDYWLSGKITVGTTPTANTRIEVWVIPIKADAVYHDVFGGTDVAETPTSRVMLEAYGKLHATMDVDATTSDRGYEFSGSVAATCQGYLPPKFQVFVTHNTAVALNATGGNHVIDVKGRYSTSGG